MNRQSQLTVNLMASIVAFTINVGITFFLTPYITNSLGVEAFGFLSLGTNFINYASLATVALNSMAGRFITIEIHQNNWGAANKYFNSVLLANFIAAVLMLIPAVLCVFYIDVIVKVPAEILTDVRILFTFLFINYIISIIVSAFSVSTFATNKLYLKSLRDIESIIIKAVLIILLFACFKPAVSYLGIVSFIVLLYTAIFNVYYMKKFLPKIKIKKMYFELKAVIELISSGIWNTIIQVGNVLLQGADLLIANLFISATAMGTFAVAKTLPIAILSLVGVISTVFMPDFTILYAQKKFNELLISIKRSMKLLGIISTIPISILVSFGEEFFKLWVPTQDSSLLQTLSIITIAIILVSGPINSIYGVFTVTNKLKTNAIILLFTGLLNLLIVFILLRTTNLGLYAIAGVSTMLGISRNLMFTAPFGAKYLGLKWYTFFPDIARGLVAFSVVTVIGLFLNYLFDINSWLKLIVFSGLTGGLGMAINVVIFLDKFERKHLKTLVIQKLNRR